MKILLLFTLLTLIVFSADPVAEAQAPASSPNGAPGGDNNSASAETATPVPFDKRFEQLRNIPNESRGKLPKALPAAKNACVPDSLLDTYGFYTLNGEQTSENGDVNYSVFSRMQYYALTPHWTGNITIPGTWEGKEVTREAHLRGSKVDLVISNELWFYDNAETTSDPAYKFDGLWLTKSYVLLTLIDDIVGLVETHNFDGVTIDFRLPANRSTVDSYNYFIKRLKTRLKEERRRVLDDDLLRIEEKQLNIVVDSKFLSAVAVEPLDSVTDTELKQILGVLSPDDLKKISVDLTGDNLKEVLDGLEPSKRKQVIELSTTATRKNILKEVSGSVDLVFVDDLTYTYLNPPPTTPERPIPEIPEENIVRFRTDVPPKQGAMAIMDVANQATLSGELQNKIFGTGFHPQNSPFGFFCASREPIAAALTGLAPFLALLVLVSWAFYDFPPRVKKSISNLIIWGAIAAAFVVFILLLIGLPSLNYENILLYIIVGGFVIPLLYLIWFFSAKVGERNYP